MPEYKMASKIPDLNEKVLKYETFLNETLKSDLKRVLSERDSVYKQIADYLQLRNLIESIKATELNTKELKTKVDLGCNFYVQAVVFDLKRLLCVILLQCWEALRREIPDASRIYVNIGFGFYAEFTLDEALKFIVKKVRHLEDITKKHTAEALRIKTHMRMVIEGLRELQFIDEADDATK